MGRGQHHKLLRDSSRKERAAEDAEVIIPRLADVALISRFREDHLFRGLLLRRFGASPEVFWSSDEARESS